MTGPPPTCFCLSFCTSGRAVTLRYCVLCSQRDIKSLV
uniref:Uncharacterized protein n=1 Tax=Anguilla anguilla TaxID=7936 RepID=A0A0E9SB02_ANGAN